MFTTLTASLIPALFLCALMFGTGCDDDEVKSYLNPRPYDIHGHWVGNTSAGDQFTMDLHGVASNRSGYTGQMTRNELTGSLVGTTDLNGKFTFTVTWLNGGITTGHANVYDTDDMKDGSMTESGITVTFTANKS